MHFIYGLRHQVLFKSHSSYVQESNEVPSVHKQEQIMLHFLLYKSLHSFSGLLHHFVIASNLQISQETKLSITKFQAILFIFLNWTLI